MDTGVSMILEQMDIHCHQNEWFVSVDTALEGVTAAQAAWTHDGASNSIWQIVNHLIFWNEDAIHRIKGTNNPNKFVNNDATFGEPGNPENEAVWVETVSRLRATMEGLKGAIAELNDEQLNAPCGSNTYTMGRLLGNLMMHDTYHLGQIVLLRKLQASWAGYDWS